ncbi:hypothetical protein [Labedaea rhizosphaerae]|uniref:hypothetical protein n=1 Tax=Labedaea rhizosphaerae TaxID=598644 RepID=UPI00105B75A4|nr:hypothetical protein [Labedaea rhizosphaerae]
MPVDAQPITIRSYRVYMNIAPDVSLAVRPSSHGMQTFMYITGPKAPTEYRFGFHIPADTKLQKLNDGSISLLNENSGATASALKQPWAIGASDHVNHRTSFSLDGNSVTQTIDLTGAQYPVVADPNFDDPLTQLLEGRVAALGKDGPSTSLPLGYGRIYTGPNGLEIRLTSLGSVKAVETVAIGTGTIVALVGLPEDLSAILGGALASRISWIRQLLKRIPPKVATALAGLKAIADANTDIDSIVANNALQNQCIGITIQHSQLGEFLARAATVMGNPFLALPFTSIDTRIWLEPCSSTPKPRSAPATSQTPAANSPNTSSQTTSSRPTQAQTTPPQPQQVPQQPTKPAHVDYGDIVMIEACQKEYPGNGAGATYLDWNDPKSWVCTDASGGHLGPVSVQYWCNVIHPGSTAVVVENTAYGWRCRT